MSRANAAQDFLATSKNDPDLHFDAERLDQARERLAGALRETLVAAGAQDHTLARQRLGAALHALQVRRGRVMESPTNPAGLLGQACVLQGDRACCSNPPTPNSGGSHGGGGWRRERRGKWPGPGAGKMPGHFGHTGFCAGQQEALGLRQCKC